MLKNLKNKKKKGFTLIELVVVIAIIAILAAVLIPRIAGYIDDAKVTAVKGEAKEIVTAAQAVNAKEFTFNTDETWGGIKTDDEVKRYMGDDTGKIKKIDDGVSLEQLIGLVEGTHQWDDGEGGTKDDIAEPGEITEIETSDAE